MRSYLRFGAVRYLSHVWLNGIDLGSHEGGDDPFEFEVTKLLRAGQLNTLIVRVASPFLGGVNQHVSIVAEPDVRIIDGFARPNAQAGTIRLDVTVENNTSAPAVVDLTASLGEYKPSRAVGRQTASATVPPGRSTTTLTLSVPQPHPWNLDDPFLYTISITSQWRGASNDVMTGGTTASSAPAFAAFFGSSTDTFASTAGASFSSPAKAIGMIPS